MDSIRDLGGFVSKFLDVAGGDPVKATHIFRTVLSDPDNYANFVKQGVIKTAVPAITGVEAAIASAAPSMGSAATNITAPIATAAAKGGGFFGGLLSATGGNILADKIAQGVGGAVGPTQYARAEPSGASKYLVSPETGMSYQQYYESVLPRIRTTNAFLQAIGQAPLPEPETPQEFVQRSANVLSQQQEEATNRMIRQTQANREYDALIESLKSQAQVATEREKSLGAVQRQRVESSYNAASSMLNQAIKDVVARERYDNNTTLAELAKPV
jgi:hypothetical protein